MQGYEASYSPNYIIDRDPRPSKSDAVSMLRRQCGAASVFCSLQYSCCWRAGWHGWQRACETSLRASQLDCSAKANARYLCKLSEVVP